MRSRSCDAHYGPAPHRTGPGAHRAENRSGEAVPAPSGRSPRRSWSVRPRSGTPAWPPSSTCSSRWPRARPRPARRRARRGRSRSGGCAPPTSARSWPPAPGVPVVDPARRRSCPDRCHTVPTRSLADYAIARGGASHDRDRAAAAAGGPDRRAPAAQAGRDPRPRPRGAGHREDPALDTGGAAAHPDRGRDRRPGRVQRPQPAAGRRLPRHQDPRRVRRGRVLRPARRPSTTSPRLEWITGRGEPA